FSYLLLIPILQVYSASFIEKCIYFFFNGLIVFAMAINTNFAGHVLNTMANGEKMILSKANSFSFIENAYAENNTTQTTTVTTSTTHTKTSPSEKSASD